MLSAYTSGGDFESVGYGYGPGVGHNYDKLILIISRASGAPVIANAMTFGARLVQGNLFDVARAEFAAADAAGLQKLLAQRRDSKADAAPAAVQPPKEPVTAGIPGIEVMDIEAAVQVIWQAGLYAESAMGCTGPLVLVSEANREKAVSLLKEAGFIGA